MKRQEFVGLGLVVALVSWAGSGIQAQGAAQDAKAKTTAVTGCLAKGADATTFTLSDAMPATADKEQSKEAATSSEKKTYAVVVKDTSLKLADHVGHKVTLTGTIEESRGSAESGRSRSHRHHREGRHDAEPLGDGTEDGRSVLHAVGAPTAEAVTCSMLRRPLSRPPFFLYGGVGGGGDHLIPASGGYGGNGSQNGATKKTEETEKKTIFVFFVFSVGFVAPF